MLSPILTLSLCEMLPHIQRLYFLFKIPLFPSSFPPPVLYYTSRTLYTRAFFPEAFMPFVYLKSPSVSPVRQSEIEIPLLVTSGASHLSSKLRPGSLLHLSSHTPQVSAALGFPVFLEGASFHCPGPGMALLSLEGSTAILY